MPAVYSGRWVNRGKLRPLPGAAAEGRWVAGALGSPMLTDTDATETTVVGRLADAPVIHFATHGLAYSSEAKARASFVAFAPDARNDGLLTVVLPIAERKPAGPVRVSVHGPGEPS